MPWLGGTRRNIAITFGKEKREWCGYATVKKFKDIFTRFNRIQYTRTIIIGQDRRPSAKKQNITSARSAILLVLLRYAKYCFRSINDTINQNYRDKRYDTIIL